MPPGIDDLVAAPPQWRSPVRTLAWLAGDTIRRLASASLPDSADPAVARWVGAGVARKISLMPVHVGFVVLVLTCAFGAVVRVTSGRRVADAPEAVIRRHMHRWSAFPLALVRDAMLLYGRLARFQYQSRRETAGVGG